jgi:hypothetical protein
MEVAMEVWRYSLSDRIDSRGVHVWFDRGEKVDVEGQPYVRLNGGAMVPMSDTWHPSEQDAKEAAAKKIASYVHALSAQYSSLREPVHAVA